MTHKTLYYLLCEKSIGVSEGLVLLGVQVRVGLLHQAVHEGGLAVMQVTN